MHALKWELNTQILNVNIDITCEFIIQFFIDTPKKGVIEIQM